MNFKGWNSQAHSGSPGMFDSSNISRDNVSREIGRSAESSRAPSGRESAKARVARWLAVK